MARVYSIDEKNASYIRVPPQSLEAEISTLGSLMLDKDAIFKVADILAVRDFYKPLHQDIYEAMLDLVERREPIDVLSVTNRLKEKGKLETIGGSSYLASLVNAVPTASHVAHYAGIVKRKRLLRDLIEASQHIAELGYQEAEDVEGLIDEAEQKIFGIAKDSLRQEFIVVKEILEEAWERIDRLHKGDGALRGVSTGYPDLDSYLAGLQRSDLIILAARPSLGKTALALNIARNVAIDEKKSVGIFSLEMSREQIIDRLISMEAKVDLWRIRTGRMRSEGAENDFVKVRDAMETLSGAPLYIDDTAAPTVMELRAKARRLKANQDLGLVVVDYLQLVRGRESESRVQEVSEITRSLKALAKELNVPVLAVSQLSRAVEMRPSSKPKLSDLRESGSIEQDSDVVMFIYREDKVKENTEKKNIAEILIEKHRNGPTGKIELYFNDETASFRSIAKHYEEPI